MSRPRHKLSEKDLVAMTAVCAVCGPVAVRKNGPSLICAVKRAENQRAWVERNPEGARLNRAVRSVHELSDRSGSDAFCAECDTRVDLVPYGRGFACGNRARELRSVQQERAAGRCGSCWVEIDPELDGKPRIVTYLRADGSCPRCSDPASADLGASLRAAGAHHDAVAEALVEHVGFILSDLVPAGDDFESLRVSASGKAPIFDRQSVTPRLGVIGSTLPWNAAT